MDGVVLGVVVGSIEGSTEGSIEGSVDDVVLDVVLAVVVEHKLLPQRTGQYTLIALTVHWLIENTPHSGGSWLQFNVSQRKPGKNLSCLKLNGTVD